MFFALPKKPQELGLLILKMLPNKQEGVSTNSMDLRFYAHSIGGSEENTLLRSI